MTRAENFFTTQFQSKEAESDVDEKSKSNFPLSLNPNKPFFAQDVSGLQIFESTRRKKY